MTIGRLLAFAAVSTFLVALAPPAGAMEYCDPNLRLDVQDKAYVLGAFHPDENAYSTWVCIETNGVPGPQRDGGVTLLGDVDVCMDVLTVGDICNLDGVF